MSTKRILHYLLSFTLFFLLTSVASGQEDKEISARDRARTGLVKEVGGAIYNVEGLFFSEDADMLELKKDANLGTAFGVTPDGLVMVAYHVLTPPMIDGIAPTYTAPSTWNYKNGEKVHGLFVLNGISGVHYIAEIIAVDTENDLAIISIAKSASEKKFPFLSFELDPPRYDSVIAIGAPFGFQFTVTEGIVSVPTRKIINGNVVQTFIQTNTIVHPGNSGGPLLLLRNHRVLGVLIQLYRRGGDFGIGIGLAVPASVAMKFLDDTLKKF